MPLIRPTSRQEDGRSPEFTGSRGRLFYIESHAIRSRDKQSFPATQQGVTGSHQITPADVDDLAIKGGAERFSRHENIDEAALRHYWIRTHGWTIRFVSEAMVAGAVDAAPVAVAQ